MNSYAETPDAWIERQPEDDGPQIEDACMVCDKIECICPPAGHCDICEQPTDYPLEDGVCRVCDITWQSMRRLVETTNAGD